MTCCDLARSTTGSKNVAKDVSQVQRAKDGCPYDFLSFAASARKIKLIIGIKVFRFIVTEWVKLLTSHKLRKVKAH